MQNNRMLSRKLLGRLSGRAATRRICLKRRGRDATVRTFASTTTNGDPLWTLSSSASTTLLPSLNGLNGATKTVPVSPSTKPIVQEEDGIHAAPRSSLLSSQATNEDAPTSSLRRRRRSSSSIINSSTAHQKKRYAVLVDSENAQLDAMDLILREIRDFLGEDGANIAVRRVYGDFSRETAMRPWLDFCLAESFLPVHAFTYVKGKGSSTDAVLIIDTMELLFTSSLDGFCFVTSDSDFTRLAQRLRESGKHVIGFGHDHTPEPFVASCESFVFVSDLMQRERERQQAAADAEQRRREDEERQERETAEELAARAAAEEEMTIRETQESWLSQMSQYLTSFLDKSGDTTDSLPQRFWKQLSLYTSIVPKNERSTDEQSLMSTTRATGTIPKLSVPRSKLDSLHTVWTNCRNDDGYVQISVLAQHGGVTNVKQYGYNKFSEFILDHPDEFEVKRADGRKTLLAKSLKVNMSPPLPVEDDQLERIHKGIKENSDGTGWANLAAVATFSEIDSSTHGYRKFSELVKQFPAEFQVKTTGSTMLVKSSS